MLLLLPSCMHYQDQKIKCSVNCVEYTSDDQSSDLLLHGRSMTTSPYYSVKADSKDWKSRLCARCTMHQFAFFFLSFFFFFSEYAGQLAKQMSSGVDQGPGLQSQRTGIFPIRASTAHFWIDPPLVKGIRSTE